MICCCVFITKGPTCNNQKWRQFSNNAVHIAMCVHVHTHNIPCCTTGSLSGWPAINTKCSCSLPCEEDMTTTWKCCTASYYANKMLDLEHSGIPPPNFYFNTACSIHKLNFISLLPKYTDLVCCESSKKKTGDESCLTMHISFSVWRVVPPDPLLYFSPKIKSCMKPWKGDHAQGNVCHSWQGNTIICLKVTCK